ncbi:riboflavin kinase [Mactra antiquata]
MAESDNEDEKFVKNVIHELSAFQKTDDNNDGKGLSDNAEGGSESTTAVKESAEPTAVKETAQDLEKKPDKEVTPEVTTDPPKPPSRIIRLSRPYNPNSSLRTSISSVTPSSASSVSSSSSASQNGTTSTASSIATGGVTATPGSRLAALQRPGSPMQRILARAQSPALAAAARLTRQASADSAKTQSGNNAGSMNAEGNVDQSLKSKDPSLSETKPEALPGQASSEEPGNVSSRTFVPPKIHSSGLTGSVLLRRPQSPLNTGRSQLLIHKQVTSTSSDSASPRSPLSPREANTSENIEESLPADKVAIRNKLRANSFRLKDLLTKRPFVRSQDSSSGDNNINNAEQNTNDSNASAKSLDKSDSVANETSENSNSGVGSDRTRWRRQGLSSIARSKSTVSERSATLISSKYIRRNRNSADNSNDVDKPSDTVESTKPSENSEISNGDTESQSQSVVNASSRRDQEKGYRLINEKPTELVDKSENKSEPNMTTGRMTGATLLRSPRTRLYSGNSSVPSSPEKTSQPKSFDQIMNHSDNVTDAKDVPNSNNDNVDNKSKAISELEKEKDVNLVFDSETIGQTVTTPSEENIRTDKPCNMSQSEYVMSQSRSDDSKHKIHSEPTSPDKLVSSVRPSQSCDNTAEADFSKSSPALKRSLAVTDLDQAMMDRDKQKLSSMFKDASEKEVLDDNVKLPCSEDKTEVLKHSESQLETDLDARLLPTHRIITRSPHIRQKTQSCQENLQSPPHSAPPVNPVAPMVYKPHINLEDAIKWPMEIPGKLDFRKMEVFEGQMLLNWLSGSIDKSHYLRLVMTKHDINVIACQVCTCLIAAGVMKQLEGKDQENVFKTDCMYYWTHTQHNSPNVSQDVNKLQPMWPPTQEQTEDNRPGLKYTEADHQAAMVTLRHEYKEEVETIQREHQGVLDKARQEYENRLQQAVERIALLQKEVDKYKCLAGIEKLTQNALSVADAAQLEAGLQPDINGYSTPLTNTPSVSQYHTPAGTPDGYNIANNVDRINNEHYAESIAPSDGTSYSGSETASLAGSLGDGMEGGSMVPPPPAPPAPPPPGMPPPAPPPPGFLMISKALKPVINPSSPMRPLFWNRIQVNEIKNQKNSDYADRRLLWEEVEEERIDINELNQLFSKRNVEPSRKFFNKPKNKAKEAAKVITPKRSQVIGILLSSLRLEMSEIEHAILTFDTSQLGEEKLRQIYENRADNDEMKKIREHIRKHPDIPLDKPDQFLYDLSLIPDYAERIFCFIFREAFQESISVIETKMTNLRMTCQALMTSRHVKRVLGLILALGNYMNGGSKSRGQADGFGIDILPKLKDVKSKDNATSLLHYTVQQYIHKFEQQDAGTDKVKFPLPDPSDLTQGCQVCFDELDKELRRIKKDFEAAEERAEKVINSAKDLVYLQPFKDMMVQFFEKGKQEFIEQEENLADGKRLFQETVIFFCVKPKSGDKVVTPEYFFSLWCSFCQDFKDIWKREQQKIIKQKIKENELKVKQMQQRMAKKPVRTRARKAGGLKDRLSKQGLLES